LQGRPCRIAALVELEGRVASAAGERLVLVRAALELFVRETDALVRQQR